MIQAPIQLLACPTCVNSFREAGGDAIGWSIMALLAVIAAVLLGIGLCMFRLARRERDFLDPELRDDFPGGRQPQ